MVEVARSKYEVGNQRKSKCGEGRAERPRKCPETDKAWEETREGHDGGAAERSGVQLKRRSPRDIYAYTAHDREFCARAHNRHLSRLHAKSAGARFCAWPRCNRSMVVAELGAEGVVEESGGGNVDPLQTAGRYSGEARSWRASGGPDIFSTVRNRNIP